jgi:hypothetical protein
MMVRLGNLRRRWFCMDCEMKSQVGKGMFDYTKISMTRYPEIMMPALLLNKNSW